MAAFDSPPGEGLVEPQCTRSDLGPLPMASLIARVATRELQRHRFGREWRLSHHQMAFPENFGQVRCDKFRARHFGGPTCCPEFVRAALCELERAGPSE